LGRRDPLVLEKCGHLDSVYLTKKSIYLVMAVIGLINWIRLNKDRNKSNE
jgi:nicotinamide mononucleotide transporter